MKLFSICNSLIILVFLSFNTLSAQNRKAISIDVVKAIGGEKMEYLSTYAKDILYIPLETKKESLIKEINKIVVEKNKIFILSDGKSILIFDIKGNFIGKVNRNGRGPQEYTNIVSFLVDPVSENICILSSQGVFEYDIKGNFICKIGKIPEADALASFIKVKDGIFLVNWLKYNEAKGVTSLLSSNSILYKDGKYQTLYTYSQKATNVTKGLSGPLTLVFQRDQYLFYKYGESIRAERANNDTIITIDSKFRITPEYIFNFGKYGFKPGDDTYEKMILDDEKIITKSSPVYETANDLFLSFTFRRLAPEPFETSYQISDNKTHIMKHTEVKAIYNKKSKELRLLKRPSKEKSGLVENIQYGPEFWPKSINSKNELISFISASKLMNYCSEKKGNKSKVDAIASKLNEEDNQVVVIVIPK